jgi:hypothetical protein
MAAGEEKKCFFCKAGKKTGLNVLKDFICFECEKEIANLSSGDPRYYIYVRDIKKFWKNLQGKENMLKQPRS